MTHSFPTRRSSELPDAVNPLIVAPLVLPAITGAGTLLFMLRHRNLGAGLSIAGTAGSLAIAIALFLQAMDGGPSAYALGGWHAPFGIILVLDPLAAMMMLLTSLLALFVLLQADLETEARRCGV